MLITNITPRDNARHFPTHPNYIEWWYVDALFKSEHKLAGSFGIWGDPNNPKNCTVRSDFLLSAPDGSLVDFGEQVPLSSFYASKDQCEVHLGDSFIQHNGDYYLLHLQKQADISLDLKIIPGSSGFGYRHFFVEDSQHFSWVVPAPHAAIFGNLQYVNELIPLDGVGYHDHNWASISQEIRGWNWGRFHGDNTAFVFASVDGNDHKLFQGLALLERCDEIFDYQYLRFGSQTPEVLMESTPSGWEMEIIDDDITIKANLQKMNLMLQREGVDTYNRVMSRLNGEIIINNRKRNISGLVVHELKLIKRTL